METLQGRSLQAERVPMAAMRAALQAALQVVWRAAKGAWTVAVKAALTAAMYPREHRPLTTTLVWMHQEVQW